MRIRKRNKLYEFERKKKLLLFTEDMIISIKLKRLFRQVISINEGLEISLERISVFIKSVNMVHISNNEICSSKKNLQ